MSELIASNPNLKGQIEFRKIFQFLEFEEAIKDMQEYL